MSGQKSVAFMNHKTWHTTSFVNIEKVWIAEQKAETEKKALEKVRRELAEEREIEDLRRQHEASTGKKRLERVDFMYRTPLADGADADEYLMGKKFEEDKKKSDIHTVASKPGSLYLHNKPDVLSDTRSKVHEDPLFAIKQQEVQKKRDVINNPVKMQRIIGEAKEDVLRQKLLDQMTLARKTAKKEEKKRRKEEEKANVKDEDKGERRKDQGVEDEEKKESSEKFKDEEDSKNELRRSKSLTERREKSRRDDSSDLDANERPRKRSRWSDDEQGDERKEGHKDSNEEITKRGHRIDDFDRRRESHRSASHSHYPPHSHHAKERPSHSSNSHRD